MTKSDAIDLFGSAAKLARAVGLSRARISQWGNELTQRQADLVTGAAVRLGKLALQHCDEHPPLSGSAA